MNKLRHFAKFYALAYVAAASAPMTPALALQSGPIAGSAVAAADVLTNDAVLRLVAAGIPEQAIVAKIRNSKTAFDTSTDQLIALKGKGVSGPVLAAMLDPAPVQAAAPLEFSADSADLSVPHYPGVYLSGSGGQLLTRMMATSSNQSKTGGILGYALTGGIASLSIKATIPGKSAKVSTATNRPVFYLFFDESVPRSLQAGGNSIWTSGMGSVTSSPAELSLVRFNEKPAAREARVGSMNIGGAKQGVMDKDRIAFESEPVRPGVFKVMPSTDLVPGEYGFIQALTGGNVSGGGGAMTARVFDFGITR